MPSITTVAPAEQSIGGYHAVRYGPGESVAVGASVVGLIAGRPHARQGDFILTHSTGLYGTLIRFGEGLRYWGTDAQFAHWNHAAIFADDDGTIIEALGGGVQKRNISVYHDTEYVVVYLPVSTSGPDRQQAADFADVSIGLSLLTGGKLGFGIDGQQICSALVARCIERIGEIFKESEPWHIMPADLAKHFDVRLMGDRGRPPERGEGVVAASRPGWRQNGT
ncbi:MAG: hypothetical protein JWO71_285 [Candidatus Acidoferrum typicum]|nr:hypothetical protein [Candidatus Acidoferrum typicum]